MPTIMFTAGAKGGTGKSTAIRFLTTYLWKNGHDPLLLDMDDENRTMSRFFPQATRVEIKKVSSYDILIKKIIAGTNLIVADLKAGVGRETLQWWLDIPFDDEALANVSFICLTSITSSPDSVQSFLNWASELKGRVSYVVFKNQKNGDTFPDFDSSKEALDFRMSANPIEIDIPLLDAEYMTELERLNLTVSEVLEANGKDNINGKPVGDILSDLMVRSRLRRVQDGIYNQLNPILNLIR